jgi:hypothetical protein
MRLCLHARRLSFALVVVVLVLAQSAPAAESLTLARDGHWLVIRGLQLPGGEIRINYLEAYCRPRSTEADWVKHTVIPHRSELLSASADGRQMQLRDTLEDGVVVEHAITAGDDQIDFRLTARNPTSTASGAHWGQACVRLGVFTGFAPEGGDLDDYLPKCFVFVEGKLTRMPLQPWAKQARYTPGQVWGAPGVPSSDLNPRPHSTVKLSHGLIGCFSADEKLIFATAWEPYQELFQGVARCLHSDLRIGGLAPGETKQIRGKIYITGSGADALLERYAREFPEHQPH